MNASRILFALPVAMALFLGGCASDASDDVAGGASAVTATDAITLANYVTHPKIKAIRAEVGAIDAAGYEKAENPGCDGNNTKWTDASGKIRKVLSEGGEGDGSGSTTAYYGANGKLRFLFFTFTGSNPDDGGVATSQSRVYFDDRGQPIWQVSREASSPLNAPPPDMSKAPDTITPDDAKYVVDDGHEGTYENPETWYAGRGCGEP